MGKCYGSLKKQFPIIREAQRAEVTTTNSNYPRSTPISIPARHPPIFPESSKDASLTRFVDEHGLALISKSARL
jgi:hypothetical protein